MEQIECWNKIECCLHYINKLSLLSEADLGSDAADRAIENGPQGVQVFVDSAFGKGDKPL